jgi:hypothetical protein
MGDMWVRLLQQAPAIGTTLTHDPKLRFVDGNGNGSWDRGEPAYHDADDDKKVSSDDVRLTNNKANDGDPLEDDRRLRRPPVTYGGFITDFGARPCGEGSLWYGDLRRVASPGDAGSWSQLPGPPVYWGNTGSGATSVATKETASGHLVFFGDQDTWNVSVGRPRAGGWFRLEGLNASEAKGIGLADERIFVHVGPHSIAWTSDFDLTLRTSTQPAPHDRMAELGSCAGGRLWVSTDGGVFSNSECGELDLENKNKLWHPAEAGSIRSGRSTSTAPSATGRPRSSSGGFTSAPRTTTTSPAPTTGGSGTTRGGPAATATAGTAIFASPSVCSSSIPASTVSRSSPPATRERLRTPAPRA